VSDAGVAAIARRQHGLVTLAQLRTHLSAAEIRHRVDRGRLQRVFPGVFRVAGAPESWEQMALAAVLASGEGAVVSFRAVGYVWNLAGFWEQPQCEITTPSRRRTRLDGVIVHDSEILDGLHVDQRRGIPVTSVARTLCDLTACCSPNQVGRALDDALLRKLTSLRRVATVFDDLATRGRRRSTVMRELLAERGPAYHPGGSDPEVRMVRVLVAAGLPRPVQQHVVRVDGRTYRLDVAYPPYRVGLEYEGFDYHIGRTAFDARYERDRLLKHDGWYIVYVTSRTTDSRIVSDTLDALRSRGYPSPPRGPSM
jgi:hypothetical protein